MSVKYVKLETESQELFRLFIDGKFLPNASCDIVLADIMRSNDHEPYSVIMESVKSKLHSSVVVLVENVAFVKFDYTNPQIERPVLTRLLNIAHKANFFIVVNDEEILYVPSGMRDKHTNLEIEMWLESVSINYLKKARRTFFQDVCLFLLGEKYKEHTNKMVSKVKALFPKKKVKTIKKVKNKKAQNLTELCQYLFPKDLASNGKNNKAL